MHCKDARLLQLQFLIKTYNNNNNNNNNNKSPLEYCTQATALLGPIV